jgi:hypothetical protein
MGRFNNKKILKNINYFFNRIFGQSDIFKMNFSERQASSENLIETLSDTSRYLNFRWALHSMHNETRLIN